MIALLTPIFASTIILLTMVGYFWRHDRQLPILDVGVLCAFITLIYVAMPALFFIKSGYHWTVLSDPRLVQMKPSRSDVADLLWFVAAYIAAFCAVYAPLRGPGMPGPKIPIEAADNIGKALIIIFVFAAIFKIGIEDYFGVNLSPSNKELAASYGTIQLPLLWGQITHNVLGIGRIAMLGIIAFVFARKDWRFGLALAAWLLFEAYMTVSNMGSRTSLVVLILAAILCYHRLIRPIGPARATGIAVVCLGGLLGFGYLRDVENRFIGDAEIWSAATEFQVLLANGLHVSWAQAHGLLTDVPWQIRFNDVVLLIPQQLLPFEKLDMSDWYIREARVDNKGLGLMFGVVAQSKLGFGLLEIILRGAVLGAVLALIHRRCVKHATSLTALIIYLWFCASIYYTYRASTFYIATWVVYRVIPFLLLFWFFSWMFRPGVRSDIATRPGT